MAGGGEKAGLGSIGGSGLTLGDCKRLGGVPPLGDVGEGDHHALGPAILGTIGQDPADEPGTGSRLDLALDWHLGLQDGGGIGEQGVVGGQGVEIGQGPANIAGDDVEQRARRRGEEPDIELGVEKDGGEVGAVEHVLQVVGGGSLPLQRFLQLPIERCQLLVEGLQLFL